jgi:hypothetical protein
MTAELRYMMAQLRSAELQGAAEQARRAGEARAARRRARHPNLIARAAARPGHGDARGTTTLEIEPAIGGE